MASERECYGNGSVTLRAGRAPAAPAASVALAALAALAALLGCATPGGKGKPEPVAGSRSVHVEEGGDLSGLDKAVKAPEDRLVLDLMLGYRMLLLRNPDPKALDKETLQRSRDAYDRLEAILRHGGVKAQDKGERVFTVSDGDRLSLQEVVLSAAQAADKAAREGDWEKARERWKEIVQSKTAVAFTMEEAQWGLTLSESLQSQALPDSIKKRLRDVNESYLADAGREEVGKQVKALLEIVPDVKLQRELKKLANRAWEKDKRAGRIGPQSAQTAVAGTIPPPDTAKAPVPPSAESSGTAALPSGGEAAAIAAEADSLASKGKYVAALKALERGGPEQSWVKDKKAQIGDRFCEEKRRNAAGAFKDFKKANGDAAKKAMLSRTAAELDSCLFYFPDLPVTGKVRKNREMVETELKKLK